MPQSEFGKWYRQYAAELSRADEIPDDMSSGRVYAWVRERKEGGILGYAHDKVAELIRDKLP